MQTIKLVLDIIGLATTALSVILFFGAIVCWILGISPLLYRLGLGRWHRKISVLANANEFASLRADLVDSGIFREKNVDHLTKSDLAKAKGCHLLLVDYGSFNPNQIKTIISNKKAGAGMVIYFPGFSNTNRVPEDILDLINNEPHTILVNFRGRLINDILVTLLSTSYEKN